MKDHMKERFGGDDKFELYPPPPQCLNVELNNTCNQRCVFCSFHSPYVKNPAKPFHMSVDFAKKILDKAKEQGIGKKEIGLYSMGEALLHTGLEECVSYAKELGCPYVFLTSNGTLATPDRMRSLIDAGLDSIRFSINAADPDMYKKIHGTDHFNIVVENIKYLAEYRKQKNINISVSISSVITKKTKSNKRIIQEMFGNLVDEIIFIPVMDLSLLGNEIVEEYGIEQSVIKHGEPRICPMLFNSMYVGSNGNVRICCDSRAIDVTAGDLHEDMDLLKAWHSETMVHYRNLHLKGDIKNSVCYGCQMVERTVDDYFV